MDTAPNTSEHEGGGEGTIPGVSLKNTEQDNRPYSSSETGDAVHNITHASANILLASIFYNSSMIIITRIRVQAQTQTPRRRSGYQIVLSYKSYPGLTTRHTERLCRKMRDA